MVYFDLRQHAKALADFERAVNLAPGQAESHYSIGQVRIQMGQVSEAIQEYDKALKIKPGYTAALKAKHVAVQFLDHRE